MGVALDMASADTRAALNAVAVERERQERKCFDKRNEGLSWFSCAALNELRADESITDSELVHMREELVQVAAVAVAWVESLDRRALEQAA